MNKKDTCTNITILLPAGRLPIELIKKVTALSDRYGFSLYLSTSQNLRLINVPSSATDTIKDELKRHGAEFKEPGKFPIPRICIGKPHCNLGVIDTEELSNIILNHFSGRKKTKGKLKIAISGCTLCCSGTKSTDIGIIAGRDGYEIYVGGKGGHSPKNGIRIKRKIDQSELIETIEKLVDFHDSRTIKKQRLYKIMDDPEFPFPEL